MLMSVVQDNKNYARLKESTIMLVDDEPIMLDIVQALLEEEGYRHFIAVEHSREALLRLQEGKPDLLLLDLDMPEVNGFEVLRQLRDIEEYYFLPVIILTASSDPRSKLRALELGATDFLSKPVDPSELALRVRNTLSAKSYQDQLTYYDSLTGLPNRKLFIDRFGWALDFAKSERIPLVLLDIGLDRFGHINETLGMSAGDRILKTVAARLNKVIHSYGVKGRSDNIPQSENIARIDGDEFTMVLSGVNSLENTPTICRRVLEAVKKPFIVGAEEVYLTASIGIAVYPEDGEDEQTLLKYASSAKDFAKSQGMDNYQFFSREMNDRTRALMKMGSDLRRALENNEFELYYQPKVNTKDGSLMGMECLLRWFHPEKGLIPPAEFIPVAEKLGLIVPLGEWVLHEACQRSSEWFNTDNSHLKVSINVSAQQFSDAGLKASIISALQTSGLNPQNLVLEITESMLMGDVDHFISLLQDIKSLGVSFSLDDFGTGYSSLSYLKKFPISELKIDRSFLIDVPANKEDNSIVRAIIAMAHSLGQKVVAEGVEEIQQLEFLEAHDCDVIQGFYFSKPLNRKDFTEYLTLKSETLFGLLSTS